MLDFIPNPDGNEFLLVVNGNPIQRGKGRGYKINDVMVAFIDDAAIYEEVANMKVDQALMNCYRIQLSYPYHIDDYFEELLLSVIVVSKDVSGHITFRFDFNYDVDNWRYPWKMAEHTEEFQRQLFFDDLTEYSWNQAPFWDLDSDSESFTTIDAVASITIVADDLFLFGSDAIERGLIVEVPSLEYIIDKCVDSINEANNRTIVKLSANAYKNALVVPFNFPNEVKVACEQYLLYFAQFLHDIGIEATAEITERAGQVLFSVTPKDKEDALDTIREALDIYLRLPTAPSANNVTDMMNADVTIQRLSVNIQHLQGQWMLAHATIQMQAAMIEAKEERLRHMELSRLLTSGQVIIDSKVETEKSPDDDRETVIPGVLDVKPLDVFGAADVKLPEIMRRLKAWVAQQKRKQG
jgi:hypothetical protein